MSTEQLSRPTMPNPADVRRMQEAHGEPQSADEQAEAAVISEHQIEVHEVPSVAVIKVTQRKRGGVSRPQGAPENSTSSGEIIVGEAKNVELSDSAKPVVKTRQRGGVDREQGPSKQVEAEQQLDREERRLRIELGSRAVERVGTDYVHSEAARRVKSKTGKSAEPTTAAPKRRKSSENPMFDQLAEQFAVSGRPVQLSPTVETTRPKHRKGDPEAATATDDDKAPEGFPEAVWATLSDEERQRANEAWGKMSESDRAKAFNKRIIPVEKPQPGRHKKESVRLRDRAKTALAPESKQHADKKETDKKRRFRRAIGALVLVAAAVGITAEVVDDMHQTDGTHATTHDHKPRAHKQKVEKGKVITSKYRQEALKLGDTYWGLTKQEHPNMGDPAIHDLVAKELKHDGITWPDARHLPVGKRVSIR